VKINYLIIFLTCFFANAQEKIENTLNLPVDKFKSYENCCVKRLHPFPGFGDPIKNELRIYTYENEAKALVYKTGKIIKIINNKYENSKVILIKSEDFFYIYKNLTKLEVEENQIVLENQRLAFNNQINVSAFEKGIYFVELIDNEQNRYLSKFVKK